jgi:hypothetical protein
MWHMSRHIGILWFWRFDKITFHNNRRHPEYPPGHRGHWQSSYCDATSQPACGHTKLTDAKDAPSTLQPGKKPIWFGRIKFKCLVQLQSKHAVQWNMVLYLLLAHIIINCRSFIIFKQLPYSSPRNICVQIHPQLWSATTPNQNSFANPRVQHINNICICSLDCTGDRCYRNWEILPPHIAAILVLPSLDFHEQPQDFHEQPHVLHL